MAPLTLEKSYTSKWILLAVMAFGLAAIPYGWLAALPNLAAYALILGGAVYNRVDSRFRGYRVSLSAAGASATIEAGDRPEAREESPHAEPYPA